MAGAVGAGAGVVEAVEHADRLVVVAEAFGQALGERLFAGVTERAVADVVAQGGRGHGVHFVLTFAQQVTRTGYQTLTGILAPSGRPPPAGREDDDHDGA